MGVGIVPVAAGAGSFVIARLGASPLLALAWVLVSVAAARDNPQQIVLDLNQPVEATRVCHYCHRTVPASDTTCPSCGAAA